MTRLIYTSIAAPDTTFETLKAILEVSVRTNQEHQVTGMLIFNGTYFMQCIEGPSAAIEQLMANILADPRHHDIVIVGTEKMQKRYFPQWTMGYLNHERLIGDILRLYTGEATFQPEKMNMKNATAILLELSTLI